MILEENKLYECENGCVVLTKRTKLPYYKFAAQWIAYDSVSGFIKSEISEKWSDTGVSYHNDCGYNIISELDPSEYDFFLQLPLTE